MFSFWGGGGLLLNKYTEKYWNIVEQIEKLCNDRKTK